MTILRAIGLLAMLVLSSGPSMAQRVAIESGIIKGVRTKELVVYKGIPYAAAPLGELRWREPQRVPPWRGARKADSFAPACLQKGVSMPGETPPTTSEDCLYLNIWAPRSKASKPLPVIVWIHGGGFTNGSASMPLYWGDRLALKGVIVVTVAYRLGPLGFLAHPELTRESSYKSSGNFGLLDQIAALEWVQRNISVFGGDPKRVTIAGQSAGAMSVSALMASPKAKGLFHRAIGESGGLFEPVQLAPRYLLANAEREGEKYAASLRAASLDALRKLPAADLLGGDAGAINHPVIEPYVLPITPYEAFESRKYNDVPLLIGSNAEEARAMLDPSKITAATYEAGLERSLGKLPRPILDAYPYSSDEQARQARLALERDLRFGWDMWAWARLHASHGRSPVYYYSFRHRPPFPTGSIYEGWGASHFAELWYVFDHLDQESWPWSRTDRRLADATSAYWVNFARSGNPNDRALPIWPAFDAADNKVLYLSDPIATGEIEDINALKVIDAIYASLRKAPMAAR